jgi:hypothetical protein
MPNSEKIQLNGEPPAKALVGTMNAQTLPHKRKQVARFNMTFPLVQAYRYEYNCMLIIP